MPYTQHTITIYIQKDNAFGHDNIKENIVMRKEERHVQSKQYNVVIL